MTTLDVLAEAQRLAGLPPLDCEIQMRRSARSLGIRVDVLRAEVEKLRVKPAAGGDFSGTPVTFDQVEPWPEPVDGAALLNSILVLLQRYLVLPAGAAVAMALWCMYTYLFHCFDVATWLGFTSPRERCGKTKAFELLAVLTYQPLPTASITPAAFYRAVEAWHPTVLIDEFDAFAQNDELRGVLNSGHRRKTAFVMRTEKTADGDLIPRRYSTFVPLAIAKIGNLPRTLADRSIGIGMKRRTKAESVDRLRMRELEPVALEIRRKLTRWALDHVEAFKSSDPVIPDALDDRAADISEPLLAIADAVGGKWPKLGREALLILLADRAAEDETMSALLLSDIRDVFTSRSIDRIPSRVLCQSLSVLEDRPWSTWNSGKPIYPSQLATLLRPFKIVSGTIRLDLSTPKGYKLADFQDAFSRYLADPAERDRHNATSQQRVGENDDPQGATERPRGGWDKESSPLAENDGGGVAGENPSDGDDQQFSPDRERFEL